MTPSPFKARANWRVFLIAECLLLVSCGVPKSTSHPTDDAGPSGTDTIASVADCSLPVAVLGSPQVLFDRPLRKVGAPCSVGLQCESRLCGALGADACGVCLERRTLGESCGGPQQGCGVSAVCQAGVCVTLKQGLGATCHFEAKGGDAGDCDDDLFCSSAIGGSSGLCTRRALVGDACIDRTSCVVGAYCLRGSCAAEGADSCADGRPCAAGSYCSNTDRGPSCVPATLPRGGSCGIADGTLVDGDCEAGTICGNLSFSNGGFPQGTQSTCVPLPKSGESCVFFRCAEGLFCAGRSVGCANREDWRCEPLRKLGDTCQATIFGRDQTAYSDTCERGLECRSGRCRAACGG